MSSRDTKLDRIVGKVADAVATSIANVILVGGGILAALGLLLKLGMLVSIVGRSL
jgi:hypothetical protein